MPSALEVRFNAAMVELYRRAKAEAHYTGTRFLQMVTEHGGVETARILLHTPNVSDGYTALWERGRLDLTMEALVLLPEWNDLFTDDERAIARQRLTEYGYAFS